LRRKREKYFLRGKGKTKYLNGGGKGRGMKKKGKRGERVGEGRKRVFAGGKRGESLVMNLATEKEGGG